MGRDILKGRFSSLGFEKGNGNLTQRMRNSAHKYSPQKPHIPDPLSYSPAFRIVHFTHSLLSASLCSVKQTSAVAVFIARRSFLREEKRQSGSLHRVILRTSTFPPRDGAEIDYAKHSIRAVII